MDFRAAETKDLAALAAAVLVESADPRSHCLHTWSGEDAESLAEGWARATSKGELNILLAEDGTTLVGALGLEYDLHLERGWYFGPHVFSGDWAGLADAMFDRLTPPKKIHTFDAYLNVDHRRGRAFYEARGYERRPEFVHEMVLRAQDAVKPQTELPLLRAEQEDAFLVLYASAFPSSYYDGNQVLALTKESYRIFAAGEGDDVDGFAVAALDPGGRSGEIPFLAVHESGQGRGLGRSLLLNAVSWLVHDQGVTEVGLTVLESVPHARRLYLSAGFRPRYTGVSYRRVVSGS